MTVATATADLIRDRKRGATLPTADVMAAIRATEKRWGWCSSAEAYITRLLKIDLKPYSSNGHTSREWCCRSCDGDRDQYEARQAELRAAVTERFTPTDDAPDTVSVTTLLRALKVLHREDYRDYSAAIGQAVFGDAWVGFPRTVTVGLREQFEIPAGESVTDEQLQAVIDKLTPARLRRDMYVR